MFLHNLLDFVQKSGSQLKIRRGEIWEEPPGHGLYLRMTVSERIQHGAAGAAASSLLVITGFMLRYPEAWWVVGIRRLVPRAVRAAQPRRTASRRHHGRGERFTTSATSRFTARGRQLVSDLLAAAARTCGTRSASIKYNLGLVRGEAAVRPLQLHREGGVLGAGLGHDRDERRPGIIMWFDNTFIGLLAKLGYDVSAH